MTAATTYVPFKYDYVTVNPDAFVDAKYKNVVYQVVKINPKNVVVQRVDGNQEKVNIPPSFLVQAPSELISAALARAVSVTPLVTGNLVRVAGPGWKQPADDLWVVIKVRPGEGADLAKLGGDRGKFYRDVPRGMITVITDFKVS